MARVFLVLLLLAPLKALASSCCGQTPASFTVLHQAEKVSLSAAMSYSESLGRVYSDSEKFYVWPEDKKRIVTSTSLTAASSFMPRQQLFSSLSYQRGQFEEDSEIKGHSTHFGDTLVGYTYELLPEYTYSAWKPVVFVSALVNIPTGHSIYDTNKLSEGADVTGHNQWGAGVGLTARKVFMPLTLTLQAKTLRLFEKKFEKAEVGPFYDSSVAAFATYATKWNVGLTAGILWSHLTEKEISNLDITSESSNVTSTLISAQWTFNDQMGVGASLTDQSWLGKPRNTLLSRTYTFNFNYSYF